MKTLLEQSANKNLHLEHLEDHILNFGVDGGRASLNFLRSLRDMLAGSARSSVNMTVKWDGAPAIFAGTDPSDGKFFVAKKSVFNVNPKLYKSNKEIDDDVSGDLNAKFKVALKEFSKLGIKGVLQGDLMFTDDLGKATIDGKKYYTFQPNTIVYAVDIDSDLGQKIKSAKIGVVWHTTYTGKDLPSMKAKFGADVKGLTQTSSVWMDDASYKDVSGRSTFTQKETDSITAILSEVGKTFRSINGPMLRKFLRKISNPRKHASEYSKYVEQVLQKQVDKVKTPSAKQKYKNIQKQYSLEFRKHANNLANVAKFQNLLIDAKMQIVKKLNSVKQLTDTFIKTKNGFKVTNPEGYVAIDRVSGNAVKLVDRMEFSFNNFTAQKAWDK